MDEELVDLLGLLVEVTATVELVGIVMFLGVVTSSGMLLSTTVSPSSVVSSAAVVELPELSKSSRVKPQFGKSSSSY